MLKNNFYKKGYLIAVYDEADQLQAVCDNTEEFATTFNKTIGVAKSIVHKTTSGKQNTFKHGMKNLTITLIPLDLLEIEELIKEKVHL